MPSLAGSQDLLVKGYGFGLIGNIVVGILGAGIAGIPAPRPLVSTPSPPAATSSPRPLVRSSCFSSLALFAGPDKPTRASSNLTQPSYDSRPAAL